MATQHLQQVKSWIMLHYTELTRAAEQNKENSLQQQSRIMEFIRGIGESH